MDGHFVAYYRVSTDKQDAECTVQRQAVLAWLNGGNHELIDEFVEVESGKRSDRAELQKAIALCRKRKATLVIAKLDRLSRNVAFIANLMESKVNFLACDNPHANKLTIHVLAAMAEHERDAISKRTSERLQSLKALGKPWVSKRSGREVSKLGSPDPSKGAVVGARANAEAADQFAAKMLPVIDAIRARGITTLAGIAEELNRQRWPTSRGGDHWSMSVVSSILKRRILSPETRPEGGHEHPL
jgi:DNA invertase Pin-like site-specific DNA recombinase